MRRFEVWLTDFDPSQGFEIQKTRPAVILSPNAMNKYLELVIVAPLTSTIKKYPYRMFSLFKGRPGEIALDQMRAIDKTRLIKKVGVLEEEEAEAICELLTYMFKYQN